MNRRATRSIESALPEPEDTTTSPERISSVPPTIQPQDARGSVPKSHTETRDLLVENNRLLQEKIRQLEAEHELLQEQQRLQAKVVALQEQLLNRGETVEDHYGDHKDLDFKEISTIPTFTRSCTIQARDEWLQNMQFLFEGAPKRYYNDKRKILQAIMQMNNTCRQEWARYVRDLPTIQESDAAKATWSIFEEWTMTLISNTRQRKGDIKTQLINKFHKENQNPQDFDRELAVLEDYFSRKPEDERALDFYARLHKDLQDKISLNAPDLPQNRHEMV